MPNSTKNEGWWAARTERDVVRVDGPDAVTYLQGQLSQDIAGMPVGEAAWSLLLQPSGKVEAWLRVTRSGEDSFALDVDAGFGEAVATRLNRFKLRTKVDITVEPAGATAPPDDSDAHERERIRHGVPAMGREITDATIPAELGQWLIDASVSFTKGCYTGQELVARIDSRGGNVPRPIRGIVLQGDAEAEVGADVVDSDGNVVGHVTSASGNLALAPILRRVGVPASVTVAGQPGEVCEFPLP